MLRTRNLFEISRVFQVTIHPLHVRFEVVEAVMEAEGFRELCVISGSDNPKIVR